MAKKKSLTADQLAVYKLLSHIVIQIIFAIGTFALFFWVLTKLFEASADDKWKYLFINTLFAGTLYRIIIYYFPVRKEISSEKEMMSEKNL